MSGDHDHPELTEAALVERIQLVQDCLNENGGPEVMGRVVKIMRDGMFNHPFDIGFRDGRDLTTGVYLASLESPLDPDNFDYLAMTVQGLVEVRNRTEKAEFLEEQTGDNNVAIIPISPKTMSNSMMELLSQDDTVLTAQICRSLDAARLILELIEKNIKNKAEIVPLGLSNTIAFPFRDMDRPVGIPERFLKKILQAGITRPRTVLY
jgi:hypothetical protein